MDLWIIVALGVVAVGVLTIFWSCLAIAAQADERLERMRQDRRDWSTRPWS